MSTIVTPGINRGVVPGVHGYHVPRRSGSMKVAHHTERGVQALYVSKYGVQGGRFAALVDDALKTAQILTAVAYYLLGIAQIVRGSLTLYWAAKRSHFYSKVRQGLDRCDNADAKAAYVWEIFQSHMSVDSKTIDEDLAKFKKEYDAKGVDAKQAALVKDYEDELNSWFDFLSDIGYRIQSWAFGLFGKELRGENLIQKRHAQVRQEMRFISHHMKSLSLRGATVKEMHATLDSFKRARMEDSAKRVNLKALAHLTSPEFAAELYHNRDTVNMGLGEHRGLVLNAYLKAEANYHAEKVANIIVGVARIILGFISIVLVASVKAAWVRILIGALGNIMYTRSVIQGVDTARYLLGGKTRETFTQEVHKLFNTFNSEHIRQIHLDDEIYGDY